MPKKSQGKTRRAKWLQSFSEDEPPIGESCNRYYISIVKNLIFKQLSNFFRVYIASSKHEEGLENSSQLCKPETTSRVCITFENSANPPSV